MPHPQVGWTLEQVHALPDDGNRYELLDGALLVSPSPTARHQRVLSRLNQALVDYASGHGGFEVFFSPFAVTFSARRELQPDLLVLPFGPEGPVTRFEDVGRLLLAVEVLSPSTAGTDRYRKRPVYQEEGVPEYWIVDPDACLVERWRPGDEVPEVLTDAMTWQPDAFHAPLAIDLKEVLRQP